MAKIEERKIVEIEERKMAKMVEGFHFVSEPSRDYFCPVTLEVMLNPRQTNCCGSHISSSAAETLAKKKKPCPMCKAPTPDSPHRVSSRVFTTHRDQYFQRIILDLEVLCPHRVSGCEWVGPLREIRDHSASCKRRPWICQHCMIVTTYNVGTSLHAQQCPQRPIYCACSKTIPIPFSTYDDHLKKCPVQVVPCEFADVGCTVRIFRKDHESHLKESLHHHQLLTSQVNLRITRAIQSKLESKKDVLGEKMQQHLEEKEIKISDLQKEVTKLNGELNQLQMAVIELQDELKNKVEADGKKILDKLFDERDRQLREWMQERDEEIQYLQESRVHEFDKQGLGTNMVVTLSDVIEELKSKNNLGGKDIKKFIAQLEDILFMITDGKFSESDSISNEGSIMAISPVNVCTTKQGNDTPHVFKGVLEKTLIRDLERACGLAVSGEVVYVVDTNGAYGLHVVSSSLVRAMIMSASFSDVRIPAGKCWYPKCVALDKDLNILLVDSSSRVLKFSPSGKLLAHAGNESSSGSSVGEFNNPMGIAVDSNGKIFVCDSSNHRVQILDSNLDFISTFGEKGSGVMAIRNPWDVSFDSQGNIYIADYGNHCVKVFNPEMSHLRNVGKGEGIGGLRAPTSICIDSKDNLYVTDKHLRKVLIYNLEGSYMSSFGKFLDPKGICVDLKGHVYVSDNGGRKGMFKAGSPGRVQVFT